MKIIEGFVIKCIKYKDSDAILNIINDDEEDSILLRGAYKPTSKLFKFTKTFYYAKFETYEGSTKYKKLRDAQIIEDYNLLFSSLDALVLLETFKEFILKTYNQEDVKLFYKLLRLTYSMIKSSDNVQKYVFMAISYALKISGYGINTFSKCSKCGATNNNMILSIKEGGFVCDRCCNFDDVELSKEELYLLESVFSKKYKKTDAAVTNMNIDYIRMIKILLLFFEYHSDTKIISLCML